MSQVKISIIVPNFNHAHYLPNCLNAIAAQKVAPHEVLLADDASADSSLQIAETYKDKIQNFRILTKEKNEGVNKNLNDALLQATGTHAVFAAADDWMLPDFIAEAYIMLAQYPEVAFWSSGSWVVFEDDTNRLYPYEMNYPANKSIYMSPEQVESNLYKFDSWFAGNTIIHNKKIFLAEGGFDPSLKSFADGLLYRANAAKYGCCFTPKRLGVWRIRQESHSAVCSKEIDTMRDITKVTMQKLDGQYKTLFSNKYKRRTLQRMIFATVKLIWARDKNMSRDIKNVLQKKELNNLSYFIILICLKFISTLPVGQVFLGQMILLINYKPFDLLNIFRAKLRNRMQSKAIVG